MRTLLLLTAMLLAPAAQPCCAQSRNDVAAAAAADARQSPARPPREAGPRSAFGRVMAVLIAKLVQDSQDARLVQGSGDGTPGTQPITTPHGGAATLPIDIDVGPAFRPVQVAAADGRLALPDATSRRSGSSGSSGSDDPPSPTAAPMALQASLPAR